MILPFQFLISNLYGRTVVFICSNAKLMACVYNKGTGGASKYPVKAPYAYNGQGARCHSCQVECSYLGDHEGVISHMSVC